MSTPIFNVGDKVRLSIDGLTYRVHTVSPERANEPGEKLYFIVPHARLPWQSAKTHLIPHRAALQVLQPVR